MKDFFEAQPIDLEKTVLEIDTTPRLGSHGVSGGIEVDGKKVTDKTPASLRPIAPGRHQVRVHAEGYVAQEMDVDVKPSVATQLSLALKPEPKAAAAGNDNGAVPANNPRPSSGSDGHPSKKGKPGKIGGGEEDPGEEHAASKELVVTASPARNVYLDGRMLGASTGLRVPIRARKGDLRIGDPTAPESLAFTYANRLQTVTLRPVGVGTRTLLVDGELENNAKLKPFEIDQRPRRIELIGANASKQIILIKLAD